MEVTQDSRRELVATLLKEAIDAAEGGEEEELNKFLGFGEFFWR